MPSSDLRHGQGQDLGQGQGQGQGQGLPPAPAPVSVPTDPRLCPEPTYAKGRAPPSISLSPENLSPPTSVACASEQPSLLLLRPSPPSSESTLSPGTAVTLLASPGSGSGSGSGLVTPDVSAPSSPLLPRRSLLQPEAPPPAATTTTTTAFEGLPATIGPYRLVRKLGEGAFSLVGLAQHAETGEYVAIKYVSPATDPTHDPGNLERLRAEAALLASLDHPGVMPCRAFYTLPGHALHDPAQPLPRHPPPTALAMVMPWYEGGDLYDWLSTHAPVPPGQARAIWSALAHALARLHAAGIAHRDLKLENILLPTTAAPDRLVLTDFGFAKTDLDAPPTPLEEADPGAPGSDEYAAPELLVPPPPPSRSRASDPRRSDIWALGVIGYALVYGRMPFIRQPGQTRRSFLFRVASAQIKLPPAPDVPESARSLLALLLKRRGEDRPTIQQVLSHPYFS